MKKQWVILLWVFGISARKLLDKETELSGFRGRPPAGTFFFYENSPDLLYLKDETGM
jgi:hypothetical protein